MKRHSFSQPPFLLMEEVDFARELPTIRTDDGRRKEVIAFCPT